MRRSSLRCRSAVGDASWSRRRSWRVS